MYVCLCHGFTDKQVKDLARNGTQSAAKVYQHFGVRPRCGKCVPYVRDMIRDSDSGETAGCGAGCGCAG